MEKFCMVEGCDVAFQTGHGDSSNLAWCLLKARGPTAHSWQQETLSISGSGILPESL